MARRIRLLQSELIQSTGGCCLRSAGETTMLPSAGRCRSRLLLCEIHQPGVEADTSREESLLPDQKEERYQSSFENRVIPGVILKTERSVAALQRERGKAHREVFID